MATAKTPSAKGTKAKTETKKPKSKLAAKSAAVKERVNAVPVAGHVNKKLEGFVEFLREQAVVGLAIGIVIGSQVQSIAKSLVNDFINPLVALLMPGSGDLANKAFYVQRAGEHPQKFMWGDFVSALISFVILIAVIYFVIKGLKLDKLDKKKEKEEAKK
ncbi:MAG TPA: MscL family protein [Candidatus Saccharimonadales bacterium]|nr:MscL family protein [Candidatus Saccharimonadales bacterium]